MHFFFLYLTMWNKLKIHVFGNVLFLHIVWYSCVFSILKPKKPKKTLILHAHRNVLSFPHIVYFPCILAFLYVISSTLKIHVFRKVIQLYLNKRDFCMRFTFLVRKLKNTKMTRFSQCCFVFSYRVISMIFSVLVNNTLINTQKTGFWKSRFFSPYMMNPIYFGVLYLIMWTHSKYTFLVMLFYFFMFCFFMRFSFLVPKKLENNHNMRLS